MYQIGDWVVYGIHGVCQVIGTEKQLVNRKRVQFLVLSPRLNGESRFYVPMDNPTAIAKLKAVLSREELIELITSDAVYQDIWVLDESRRRQYFRELLSSGDRLKIMQMVTNLYRYKAAQLASGRKFHQSDDNFLRDAEKLLSSEISLVMELSHEDARNYLHQYLNRE